MRRTGGPTSAFSAQGLPVPLFERSIEHVAEVREADWYAEACRRAGARERRRQTEQASAERPALAPPVALSSGPLGAVQSADREIGRQTAVRARAVAAFAATRPSTADRAQGEPGAMSAQRWNARAEILRPVSEWAGAELMVALSISAEAADALLTRSLTLAHRLPGTLAALEAGALHPGHLWTMLEKVAPIDDARVRAEVEGELLRWVAGRVVTPAQLGAKARREVARRDARAAARRLEKALRERGLHLRPHAVDGMATVTIVATMPEAQALHRALTACADTLDDVGDPRTRGQKMIDCLLDLVLRPGETDLPPVQVLLTMVASLGTLAGGDAPGEIDGQVVPAEMIRRLLTALTGEAPAADAAPCPEAEQDDLARWWAEMERRVMAGELVGPEDEHVCDADCYADRASGHGPDHPADPGDGPPETLLDEPPPTTTLADEPSTDRGGSVGSTAGDRPPRDGGWWAAADQAVDDTSSAVLDACRKVAHAQRLVRAAVAADAADESAWRRGPAGRLNAAEDAVTALLSATAAQREHVAGLLAMTRGGGLADRPRIALTYALSGTLLALTDLRGLTRAGTCGRPACRRTPAGCTHDLGDRPRLGPPGPTDAYRPSAELDRWVRARDRRCRFPGCRRRVPKGGELDHDRPCPIGSTSAENLVGYCTADHRGKHQAPEWQHRLRPDGMLTVTTPTGLVAVTTPPPY
ncbi:MAG: uncharacterized protein JWP33_1287 [Blastococcus sp.]|nr:uncharacterized protein [Blastococcus sp.]